VFEQYNDVVTVKELCEMLRIGRNTAYELIRSGQISGILVGRQIRVRKESVIQFFMDPQNPTNEVESPLH